MRFAWTVPDGSVTILAAAPKEQLERVVGTPKIVDGVAQRVLTDEEYRAFVLAQNFEKGVIPADAIDLVELPEDWTAPDPSFRAAWVKSGTVFGYDMEKCRTVTRDRLRREREPLLAELDEVAIRATEKNDRKRLAEVAAQKQRLRDITDDPRISEAKTPDDLKQISVV